MISYLPANNLDELLAALRSRPYDERLMTNLPTFGGEEPASTGGVWSWDATRLLVGTSRDDFRIVPRAEES
jgi:hypothetical protein